MKRWTSIGEMAAGAAGGRSPIIAGNAGRCMHSRKALFEGAHEIFFWLLFKAAIFSSLLSPWANRDEVALHFMPGHVVTMPMMAVLGSFALGVFSGSRWFRAGGGFGATFAKRRRRRLCQALVAVAESRQQASSSPADLARHMTDASITIPYEP